MISKKGKITTIALMTVLGACMHFVHELVPEGGPLDFLVECIFPINETSWEHMKMVWYPFLAVGIIHAITTRNKGYFSAFVVSAVPAMFLLLGEFAFYESLTISSVLAIDIISFCSTMIFCTLLAFSLAGKEWTKKSFPVWIVVALIITAVIIYLTFNPGPGYVFMDDTALEAMFSK